MSILCLEYVAAEWYSNGEKPPWLCCGVISCHTHLYYGQIFRKKSKKDTGGNPEYFQKKKKSKNIRKKSEKKTCGEKPPWVCCGVISRQLDAPALQSVGGNWCTRKDVDKVSDGWDDENKKRGYDMQLTRKHHCCLSLWKSIWDSKIQRNILMLMLENRDSTSREVGALRKWSEWSPSDLWMIS